MEITTLITQVKEININEYLEQKYGYKGKGTGKNIFYHCPFHNERTPSFSVWDNGKMWTCHGACNQLTGDIISLVMRIDRLEFLQALEKLCQWVGIKFSYQESPHLEIVQKAAEKYHKVIYQCIEAYPLVNEWINDKKRITKESIDFFQIGCTPFDRPDLMTQTLLKEYKEKDLIIAGLTIKKDGKLYDRFRNGIIIPIKNKVGKVVGFSLAGLPVRKHNKYINSPQSYFFNKRYLSFNMNDSRKGDYLIIVEGYTDVISIRQQGEFNVEGTMGTPTIEQIQSIPRSVNTVYLAFDNNKAGRQYTQMFMEQLPNGHHITPDNVKFCIYDGDDPDECIKNGGLWSNVMSDTLSVPVLEYMHSEISRHPSVKGNVSIIINKLAPYYAKLKPVQFDENVNALHKWIDNKAIEASSIKQQMNQEIDTFKNEQVTTSQTEFTTEQYVLCSYIWKPYILGVDYPDNDLAIKQPEEVFILDRHIKMYQACFDENGLFIGQNLDQFRELSEYFDALMDCYETYLERYHVNVERDLRGDIIKSVARLKQAVMRKKLEGDGKEKDMP